MQEINSTENPTRGHAPVHCAYDQMVAVDKLRPHPRSPQRHTKAQVEFMAGIIRSNGFRRPITVSSRSSFIIRGHLRYLAVKLLGITKAPVDFQDYSTDTAELIDLQIESLLTMRRRYTAQGNDFMVEGIDNIITCLLDMLRGHEGRTGP